MRLFFLQFQIHRVDMQFSVFPAMACLSIAASAPRRLVSLDFKSYDCCSTQTKKAWEFISVARPTAWGLRMPITVGTSNEGYPRWYVYVTPIADLRLKAHHWLGIYTLWTSTVAMFSDSILKCVKFQAVKNKAHDKRLPIFSLTVIREPPLGLLFHPVVVGFRLRVALGSTMPGYPHRVATWFLTAKLQIFIDINVDFEKYF